MTATVDKVLCYIVHDGRLLVFRHLDYSFEDVGIQVPAGTIRPGEPPERAAVREASEETGLAGLVVVRPLGVVEYDISPYRMEIQRRHVFQLATTETPPQRWRSQEEHDGQREPTRLECFWIPLASAHVLQAGQGALIGRLIRTDPVSDHPVAI
ncbi:MAG TPA: NUDIX domain-containing protein [Micromonosporaceae bacterium]